MFFSFFINTIQRCLLGILICLSTWVDAHSTNVHNTNIIYCIDPDWAPYESIVEGKHLGISHNYLKLITKYSGLTFTLYPTNTWQESLRAIAQGECQLMPMLNESPSRKANMSFSQSYFTSTNVLYALSEGPLLAGFSSLTTQSIAVVKDYRLHYFLRDNFAFISIKPVLNESEGLALLDDGKVDLFVGSFYSSNQLIHDKAYRNLKIVGITELDDKLKVGVAKSHEFLIPIINQAIDKFTSEDHRIVFAELRHEVVISKIDYTLTWQVAFIALMILIILLSFHFASLKQRKNLAIKNDTLHKLKRVLEHKNKQLAELTVKDHLTGLFNRLYLNEHIGTNIKLKDRYNTSCCLIMIDIDDFKKFNDTYGHQVGDDVLKRVARVLLDVTRETDICTRWGGEEFAILCPETSLEEATYLAERFQESLASLKQAQAKSNSYQNTQPPNLEPKEHTLNQKNIAYQVNEAQPFYRVTCSIGIAELSKNSNEISWFVEADSAMYSAKAQGKNSIFINSGSI